MCIEVHAATVRRFWLLKDKCPGCISTVSANFQKAVSASVISVELLSVAWFPCKILTHLSKLVQALWSHHVHKLHYILLLSYVFRAANVPSGIFSETNKYVHGSHFFPFKSQLTPNLGRVGLFSSDLQIYDETSEVSVKIATFFLNRRLLMLCHASLLIWIGFKGSWVSLKSMSEICTGHHHESAWIVMTPWVTM